MGAVQNNLFLSNAWVLNNMRLLLQSHFGKSAEMILVQKVRYSIRFVKVIFPYSRSKLSQQPGMYFFKSRSLDEHDGAHCNSIPETEDHEFKSCLYCIVKSHLKEKKKATLGLVLSSYFIFIRRRAEEINQWLKILLHKQENPLQSDYPSLSSYKSR